MLLDEHVWDPRMRKLIRQWLEAGLVYQGKREATEKGTPQGGPISPLLANLSLHYFDRLMQASGHLGQLVRYADEFVVLCPSQTAAIEANAHIRTILGRLGLRWNEGKTRIVHLSDPKQGFDFLGYTHRLKPDTRRPTRKRLHRWPSTKAVQRIGEKIKAHLSVMAVAGMIPDVAERLSSVLRGWGAYFRWGHSRATFCKVDNYVRRRFALCLSRIFGRHGTGWSWRTSAGKIMTIRRFLKVLGLYELCGTERPWAPAIARS
jgi:group II intron reverse transcriptase/maturase